MKRPRRTLPKRLPVLATAYLPDGRRVEAPVSSWREVRAFRLSQPHAVGIDVRVAEPSSAAS